MLKVYVSRPFLESNRASGGAGPVLVVEDERGGKRLAREVLFPAGGRVVYRPGEQPEVWLEAENVETLS